MRRAVKMGRSSRPAEIRFDAYDGDIRIKLLLYWRSIEMFTITGFALETRTICCYTKDALFYFLSIFLSFYSTFPQQFPLASPPLKQGRDIIETLTFKAQWRQMITFRSV